VEVGFQQVSGKIAKIFTKAKSNSFIWSVPLSETAHKPMLISKLLDLNERGLSNRA
jgi:hypothetical protein